MLSIDSKDFLHSLSLATKTSRQYLRPKILTRPNSILRLQNSRSLQPRPNSILRQQKSPTSRNPNFSTLSFSLSCPTSRSPFRSPPSHSRRDLSREALTFACSVFPASRASGRLAFSKIGARAATFAFSDKECEALTPPAAISPNFFFEAHQVIAARSSDFEFRYSLRQKGDASGRSKQSRSEKKSRRAMLKPSMKPVPGVNCVTLKKSKNDDEEVDEAGVEPKDIELVMTRAGVPIQGKIYMLRMKSYLGLEVMLISYFLSRNMKKNGWILEFPTQMQVIIPYGWSSDLYISIFF
ncbi:NAC-alpha domain-containing protein 1-like [Zingiber officinale]|uniref:NAC-alpha domain-containing protein 1-like n=1 Tax=Zingiber officinale TaxID=94328 RepID=UPI001C4B0E3A|nr:NAC-alpha domain-containing protein 1-like [Zingiber officinale]